MRKKSLIIGIVIVVCLIGGYLVLLKPKVPSSQPSQTTKELKLSDFSEVFKEDTLIVVGDNASEIEMQAANDIASYLENETENNILYISKV